MTVYECRCGVKVSVYVPVSLVVCGCGRQMRRQEQGELFASIPKIKQ
ncbi:MAG: hypothetical protein M0Z65_00955 [Firmicutes bacterium]|nr:hypothetical protein [Bacillota bacterium]